MVNSFPYYLHDLCNSEVEVRARLKFYFSRPEKISLPKESKKF